MKATMADWLALHGVTAAQCRAVLARTEPEAAPGHDPDWPCDPVALWRRVADLLAPGFPAADGLIQRTWAVTRTDFSGTAKGSARAFTLHDDGTGHPFVACRLKGKLSDLLTLAHEFGHAAQIVASAGDAMPPALREVCACLSERLVLRGFAIEEPELAEVAQRLVARGGRRRLLLQALDQPQAVYSYDWNYPLAHVVAEAVADRLNPAQLARLFAGQTRLADLMA